MTAANVQTLEVILSLTVFVAAVCAGVVAYDAKAFVCAALFAIVAGVCLFIAASVVL